MKTNAYPDRRTLRDNYMQEVPERQGSEARCPCGEGIGYGCLTFLEGLCGRCYVKKYPQELQCQRRTA